MRTGWEMTGRAASRVRYWVKGRQSVANLVVGNCQLCGKNKELRASHVWPKFAYRSYVSDLKRGGSFIDLAKEHRHNTQYTRTWFCGDCEGIFSVGEDAAARLCRKIEASPRVPQKFDGGLLRFAVSISLRTVLFHLEVHPEQITTDARGVLKPVIRCWKQFLMGKSTVVAPYSQHIFFVQHETFQLHLAVGGNFNVEHEIAFTQIGPLYIFGMLDRKKTSLADLKILRRSELHTEGGTMESISQMIGGDHLTRGMLGLLHHNQALLHAKIAKMSSNERLD